MKSCWSLKPKSRPKFQELVVMFSSVLERSSGYLDLCLGSSTADLAKSLCWKDDSNTASPPTQYAALPVVQEREAEDVNNEF